MGIMIHQEWESLEITGNHYPIGSFPVLGYVMELESKQIGGWKNAKPNVYFVHFHVQDLMIYISSISYLFILNKSFNVNN